jgi:hypothetical protein
MEDFATAGGGFGLDAYARLAKMLLLGGTFEYAGLGTPDTIEGVTGNFETSAHTTYVGINVGIIPNVDRVSFIGDVGFGSRSITKSVKALSGTATGGTAEQSASGLEFAIGAGISIPAGPVRIVPRANIGAGSFSSGKVTGTGGQTFNGDIASADRGTHTFFFIGVALYYSLDFGQKVAPE